MQLDHGHKNPTFYENCVIISKKNWDKSEILKSISTFLEIKLGFLDIFWRICG